MSSTFKITLLGGDGIGPEVVNATADLLRQLESSTDGLSLEFSDHSAGASEYLKSGEALPTAAFEACQQSHAVLLGAMGLPSVRYPDGIEIAPQLDLRERLGLFGGVRPIKLYHENDTPLKNYGAGDIDYVLVRESTEGLFAGRGDRAEPGADVVINRMEISRAGTERVCRLAYEIAMTRAKRLACIDKANVLSTMVFFREIFDEVGKEFPEVETEHVYIDASALFLVRDPKRFDVMVTENMFGDILSDLGAGLVGGMGMAPSGDIGADAAVFQPSHGSAPDIAGKGIANPIATILSAAMMLQWLGSNESKQAATTLNAAVANVLSDPTKRTPDMGGKLSTKQLTNEISEAIDKLFQTA